ncbi:hypothetical protein H3S74_12215 [Gilliamella sp. W8126]|uniref:type IV secretion system protein n=1 Tax=Gilliamella sp. W8126 TaxID=2750946 RepID=UPI0018DC2357|nr:type IV secretion system protein [Gilliamella sp. W8126]MBI0006994.1 hypothetical protein [Gilliamella sp. W8126]
MKTKIKVLALVTALLFSNNALSAGIPTVDAVNVATTIAENLKTLAQLKEQLSALKDQIKQAQQFANDTKKRLEGNWKLGDVINNDQFLNSLPKNAQDILTEGMTITGLRDKYGLKTDNEGLQKNFDGLMAFTERTEKNYQNTINRLKSLQQIKALSDAATTPAQKQDVANKLALLQLEFSQEQAALVQSEVQFKAQHQITVNAENENFRQSIRQAAKDYRNKYK